MKANVCVESEIECFVGFFGFFPACRMEEILEAAEDMAIDIPHIWLYLAELITPMLHEGGIPMGQLFRLDPVQLFCFLNMQIKNIEPESIV